jgi:hypothetical protein
MPFVCFILSISLTILGFRRVTALCIHLPASIDITRCHAIQSFSDCAAWLAIAILPGQSKAEEFSTLVHETAHEMLHKAERRTATTKTVRELEAVAVAFVVGKAVGLVSGTASADYIQLYQGNASLLAESLEVIQQTASVILAGLEPPVEAEDSAPATGPQPAEVAA